MLQSATVYLVAVCFPTPSTGYVADARGYLYKTEDGGVTWARIHEIATRWFLEVLAFPTATTGFVGSRDCLVKTVDGGATWQRITNPVQGLPFGQYLRLTSDGQLPTARNWYNAITEDGRFLDLIGVCFISAAEGYVAGMDGSLLRSLDGGWTWSEIHVAVSVGLRSVAFRDPETAIVAGGRGTILMVGRNDRAARAVYGPTDEELDHVCFASRLRGFAVGQQGALVATADGGETWSSRPSGTQAWLHRVSFFDEAHGIIVGAGGVVLRTDDGGATWTKAIVHEEVRLVGLSTPSRDQGFVLGYPRLLVRTADCGATFHFVRFPWPE
jgi:photosystem II stability/assembly factor-like uncharacterized protein